MLKSEIYNLAHDQLLEVNYVISILIYFMFKYLIFVPRIYGSNA